MPLIDSLSVQNFRCHDKYTIKLSPSVTVITGKNGSGKTSLLEAIYLSINGSSFKGSDQDILKKDANWWKIALKMDDLSKRQVVYDSSQLTKKKKFTIDGKNYYRLPTKYHLPVVLFEPDDLRLLHGSPQRRRRFIDSFISQIDPIYHQAVYRYDRALKQRNSLLKQHTSSADELFAWNISLSQYGAYIIEKRIAFIEKINSQLCDTYTSIAKTNDDISVHYSHTYIGDIKQKLLNDLYAHLERDRILGYTSTGPHRHDVVFYINNSLALDTASRGEIRSIVLATKFLEVEIIKQLTNTNPLVLLDDVFSELDEERQRYLMEISGGQIIITSTHLRLSNTRHLVIQIKTTTNE
jgi:DNA replication and repair protein RecF